MLSLVNEKVVKKFTNTNKQELILTQGNCYKGDKDKKLFLYLKHQDKEGWDSFEKIAEKSYSANKETIFWKNKKNKEQVLLIREKAKDIRNKNKKTWRTTSFEVFSGKLYAYFCGFPGNLNVREISKMILNDTKKRTPKAKRAASLFNKLIKIR